MKNFSRHYCWLPALIGLLAWIIPTACPAQSPRSAAQDAATLLAGDFELREWVVLVCDAFRAGANGQRVKSTLPDFMLALRSKSEGSQNSEPSPIGIIRVLGKSGTINRIRLSSPGAVFRGGWPASAMRPGEIVWQDTLISTESSPLYSMDKQHWLTPLRASSRPAILGTVSNSEHFLLYDVELKYEAPIKLTANPDPSQPPHLVNTGAAPPHDVFVYSKSEGNWRTAALSGGSAPATDPSTSAAVDQTSNENKVSMDHWVSATDGLQMLEDWKRRLAPWDLEREDLDLIVRTLSVQALDSIQMTAVYLLDDNQMNRIMPIQVIPEPKSIRRVGIVVVRNIDPNISDLIERLILQLGDKEWQKREAASEALTQLGSITEQRLRSAQQNSDPEIALRATRLLTMLSN